MSTTLEKAAAAVSQGLRPLALSLFREALAERPALSTANAVLQQLEKLGPARPTRVFVLRSFTLEPAVPLLRALTAVEGLDLEVQVGEFNAYAQEILDPGSALYAVAPQVVLFAVQARDLLPKVWSYAPDLAAGEAMALAERALSDLRAWALRIRENTQAQLLVLNFTAPLLASAGLLDAQDPAGQTAALSRLNQGLRELAAEGALTVFDYDALVARHGRARWHDERKWLTARMPIASDCLPIFSAALSRALLALRGPPRKVLVLDLDNTLWGGIAGEDGYAGLKLSAEHPGASYQAVQRAAKDLAARGVLLALASKNNPADAQEVLEKHPGMILRPKDFAAVRINWNDKAQSLREIAAELNVGIDSLVFMDDNPAERQRIRGELPEVHVLELPEDPALWAMTLRDCPGFERASTTAEDKVRTKQYAEQRERAALSQSAGSVDEYLRSLEMVLRIARVSPVSLARSAQLTQKTNQYNTTTRRRSEDELRALLAEAGVAAFTYAVVDRFGDNGIVGLAIARSESAALQIDTFLMSCRVIGRTVETAMLAHLARHAQSAGLEKLEGWFLPTAKNAPARDFYPSHGFVPKEERDGGTLWSLPADKAPAIGSWFSVIEEG